jgi:hypothetical protein
MIAFGVKTKRETSPTQPTPVWVDAGDAKDHSSQNIVTQLTAAIAILLAVSTMVSYQKTVALVNFAIRTELVAVGSDFYHRIYFRSV